MPGSPVVEIRNLAFSYDRHPVLEAVNLTIEERDFVCIVGPNGGGKSTLLMLLLGLLQPTRGEVRVFGRNPAEVSSRIGYMPQHARHDPHFPVRVIDVVLTGCLGVSSSFRLYSRKNRQAALTALERVRMADLAGRPFAALSGGQRQRVLLARALVGSPSLLLFDEPTAGLDLAVEGEFYQLLQDLNRQLTVLLVSHDLGVVSRIVDRVVCVQHKVTVHPTSDLTGTLIRDLYGADIRMIRHDHSCREDGHEWQPF